MQQATCAHSGAGTGPSSGNLDNVSGFFASRRSVLTGALGAIGVGAAAGAIAVTASLGPRAGSSLEPKWAEVKAAYAAMEASDDVDDDPFWTRIDAATHAIHRAKPNDARDAEICLWCGLLHNGLSDPAMERMVLGEDLAALSVAADDMKLDYEYLFFVRSLQGLRRAQGRELGA